MVLETMSICSVCYLFIWVPKHRNYIFLHRNKLYNMGMHTNSLQIKLRARALKKCLWSTLQMLYNINNSVFFQLFPKENQGLVLLSRGQDRVRTPSCSVTFPSTYWPNQMLAGRKSETAGYPTPEGQMLQKNHFFFAAHILIQNL